MSSKPIFNAGTERFVRDWRSTIATVTVRDQRYREHDPILGVVPLKLSDIFDTSSQVTRWYPLDGGIGFGRVRISLLFRSVETRLPPNMLGWDVGTFEFLSDRISVEGYQHHLKLKLRTGGGSAKISRSACHMDESGGCYFDMTSPQVKRKSRLPVKHRYRSPVVFEFRIGGKRGTAAYAVLWLMHLVDNEEIPIDIPIWTTKNGNRLTQNYVTERNWKAKEVPGLEDLTEVGRLKFTCRFRPGTDESHEQFVIDNDSRETYETWEACMAEGVRDRYVTTEIPDKLRELHENSLVQGRDVLRRLNSTERKKWVEKEGGGWSGAFGDDPRAYTNEIGKKIAEPGTDNPPNDPIMPPPTQENLPVGRESVAGGSKTTSDSSSDESGSEGEDDNDNDENEEGGEENEAKGNRANKRSEKRKQRGIMQWKPARNVAFAKDEAGFAFRKVKKKLTGDLSGREPDIETETG